jgi:SAM-dependent methyltransferase
MESLQLNVCTGNLAMNHKPYESIVRFCESALDRHGDNYLGVGWTKKPEYADTRYRVMLEMIRHPASERVTLLDFGCGASHLYEYIQRQGFTHLEYSGLDLSEKFLTLSRNKFPFIKYYALDILNDETALPEFDYIALNGVFTAKCDLPYEEMLSYLQEVLPRVFKSARTGISFNVMSKQVEWERDDLFHLPFDILAPFLVNHLSRNFVIRHDYGLYEYTTYVYR